MFRNPVKPSSLADEGTVVQVDSQRFVCKVQTLSGQNLDGVTWQMPVGGATRGGDRITPHMGERVRLDYSLGYPVITGSLPRLQTADNTFPLSIDTGQQLVDTGNYSADGVYSIGDQNKPKDILNGDRVIASLGGGMIAILRAGSVLLRSSRLSEIFISKWDDLVRIVSRNWEQFTDVSTDIVKNFRGRIYRYTGYASSFSNSTTENYQYRLYYGDTALAEAIKSSYQNPPGSLPAANSIIFKEQIAGSSGELMRRTLDLSGNEEVYITAGGSFIRIKTSGSQATISYNDQNTITVNGTEIDIKHQGGAEWTMDANGIRSTFAGGEINQSNSSISTTFSGHFIIVDSGGVHLG
jgi:hypothetical protein